MMSGLTKITAVCMLVSSTALTGCAHSWGWGKRANCNSCGTQQACATDGCQTAEACPTNGCEPCGECGGNCGGRCCGGCLSKVEWCLFGWMCRKSNAIPETLPLGSVIRAHDQVMETNAEAADFIIYRCEFIGQTANLNSDGKDHVLEIAARMRSTPFPVIVEREPNNSDPELDALRRNLIAQIMTDLGNPDGQQRTVVATAYGPGYPSRRGEMMYYQHMYNGNFGGGFGGGGFGGGGFGGGGFGGGGGFF